MICKKNEKIKKNVLYPETPLCKKLNKNFTAKQKVVNHIIIEEKLIQPFINFKLQYEKIKKLVTKKKDIQKYENE